MAGSLVQIDKEIITTNTASVSLTGIDSDNVYMVVVSDVYFDSNDDMKIRFTVSGSADDSSNYDQSHKAMYADLGFGNTGVQNGSNIDTNQGTGTTGNNPINLIMYLYNFNTSNLYSYVQYENAHRNTSQSRFGYFAGGGVLKEQQTTDGVHFYPGSGNNFANGQFVMYKVV